MNEYNPIEIYEDEDFHNLNENKFKKIANLIQTAATNAKNYPGTYASMAAKKAWENKYGLGKKAWENKYGLAAGAAGLYAGKKYLEKDRDLIDPDTAKMAAGAATAGVLASAAYKKRGMGEGLKSLNKGAETIIKNSQSLAKLGKTAGKIGIAGAGLYGAGKALQGGLQLKDAIVNKLKSAPEKPSANIPKIDIPGSVPSKETIIKAAKIGGAATGALATAGIVAAMIANNINKKYEWKIEGCDKLDANEKQKCLKYINTQKSNELKSELKNCKYSNDPSKCESMLKNKFKGK